jgi:hypothetical protein
MLFDTKMKSIRYLIKEKMVPPFSTLPPFSGRTEHRKATKLTNCFFGGGLVLQHIFSLFYTTPLRTLPLKRINLTKKNKDSKLEFLMSNLKTENDPGESLSGLLSLNFQAC